MFRDIQRAIEQALQRIRLPFRMRISRVRSENGIQTIAGEGLAGEAVVDVEHFEQFGLTSVPPAGSTAIAIPLGGKSSHVIVVATEHASYRMVALQTGEVAIYSSEGAHVVIKQGRVIEANCDDYVVNCKTFSVNAEQRADFNTPKTSMTGEAFVQQRLTGEGGMALSNTADGGGPVATIDGTLRATVDLIANGVSVFGHQHRETGTITDGPIPSASANNGGA